MKGKFPRLLLSGTNSGCGKTTVFCALLQALKDRGENVAAFKCGPDYIDPMFHRAVIGAESKSDSYFCGEYLSAVFADSARDLNRSGAMGYYDGWALPTNTARTTSADACTHRRARRGRQGCSLSIAARMQGFLRFRKDSNVKVLFSTAFRAALRGNKKNLERGVRRETVRLLSRIARRTRIQEPPSGAGHGGRS
ncbi:MAG: hypothetical protein ACLRTQ_08505 [Candidatus Borkfalkia sp.]